MLDMSGVTLLDGAMGSALRERGVKVPDHTSSIWSAGAILSHPDEVCRLHRDYIQSGADVIIANNYAVTPVSLHRENLGHRLEEMSVTACRLALKARDDEGSKTRIAGSLPPLNTSYRADLVGPPEALFATYRLLAGYMAPYVDLFVCETMTCSAEAEAAAKAALEVGRPVWVAFTLDDASARLRGGETLEQALSSGEMVAAMTWNSSATPR